MERDFSCAWVFIHPDNRHAVYFYLFDRRGAGDFGDVCRGGDEGDRPFVSGEKANGVKEAGQPELVQARGGKMTRPHRAFMPVCDG